MCPVLAPQCDFFTSVKSKNISILIIYIYIYIKYILYIYIYMHASTFWNFMNIKNMNDISLC